jgi:hypothetical protein
LAENLCLPTDKRNPCHPNAERLSFQQCVTFALSLSYPRRRVSNIKSDAYTLLNFSSGLILNGYMLEFILAQAGTGMTDIVYRFVVFRESVKAGPIHY